MGFVVTYPRVLIAQLVFASCVQLELVRLSSGAKIHDDNNKSYVPCPSCPCVQVDGGENLYRTEVRDMCTWRQRE